MSSPEIAPSIELDPFVDATQLGLLPSASPPQLPWDACTTCCDPGPDTDDPWAPSDLRARTDGAR